MQNVGRRTPECGLRKSEASIEYITAEALALSAVDVQQVWAIAGGYWRENHGLPLKSRLVLDKVTAFACIEFLEGRARPLATERRRPKRLMPERFRNARPVPTGTSSDGGTRPATP